MVENEPLVVSKVQVYEFDGKQFLDPSVTKGFPDFPDLIGAGSYLNWRILAFVEPWRAPALVHVGDDSLTIRFEQFRYCRDMEIQAAVV